MAEPRGGAGAVPLTRGFLHSPERSHALAAQAALELCQ